MKPLHRFALLALVAAASLGTAAAQTTTTPPPAPAQDAPPPPPADDRHSPEARLKHHLDELTKKLGLTQEQQDQIKPILADAGKQGKAIFDDTSLSKEDKMAKLKDLHEATNEKIRALLTPDQQKTFDELKDHEGHRPPPQS